MDKSPDAYRTISEVAEELDLPQHVLRFWETRFGQIKPLKRAGGRRFYRPDDVDLLKGIRHLLYKEGYTIKGVQRILKEQGARAVLALVRETAFDPAEFPAPPMQHPPIYPQPVFAQTVDPMVEGASLGAISPDRQAGQSRESPPPLEIPPKPPEWHIPGDREAEFAAFHAQEGGATPPPPPPAHPLMKAPPPPLPPPPAPLPGGIPYAGVLSLGQGAMLHMPLVPAPSSAQVSMFRGGITAPVPRPLVEAPPQPQPPPAQPQVAQPPPARAVEEGEARAILTLALQELATCRDMIEDLRTTRDAAE